MEPVFEFKDTLLDIPIGKVVTVSFKVMTSEIGDFSVTLELPKQPPLVFIKEGKPFKSITGNYKLKDGEDEFTDVERTMDVMIHPYDDGDYAQRITGYATNGTSEDSPRRNLVVKIFHSDEHLA